MSEIWLSDLGESTKIIISLYKYEKSFNFLSNRNLLLENKNLFSLTFVHESLGFVACSNYCWPRQVSL